MIIEEFVKMKNPLKAFLSEALHEISIFKFCTVSCMAGIFLSFSQPQQMFAEPLLSDGPRVVVEPESIYFGELGHSEVAEGELTIINKGTADLVITEIKPTCSCIKIEQIELTPLRPGESRRIALTMNSGRIMGKIFKKIKSERN